VPRAGLTPEVVVAEAARVADEVGYDGLTLAAVAQRFDVAVPSLYKHVDGLEALHRELAVLAIRELGEALRGAAEGRTAKEALEAMAHAYRGYARQHPGRYAATLRAPDPSDPEATQAAQDLLDTVFSVLARYRIDGPDAVDATRVLRSALHGFVALESAGGFGMPRDVDRTFDRMVETLDATLRSWKSPQKRKEQPQ
jgi:AcrR family transcriptional regulator